MTDFLTRLVSLNRGEAAVITPRLPSRYGSVTDTGPEESFESDVALASGTESPGDTAPAPLARGPAVERSPESPPGSQNDPLGSGPGRLDPEIQYGLAKPDDSAGYPGDSLLVPNPETPLVRGADVSLVQGAGGETVSRNESGGEQPFPGPQKVGLEPVGTEGDPPRADNASVHVEAVGPSRVRPDTSLLRAEPGRRAEPLQQIRDLPLESDHHAAAEPSIHVTIGRVEVRAHTAAAKPAPHPARPRPQSSLSLQDYLKRGGSGGGRS